MPAIAAWATTRRQLSTPSRTAPAKYGATSRLGSAGFSS